MCVRTRSWYPTTSDLVVIESLKLDAKSSGPEVKRGETYMKAEKLSCDLSNLSQSVAETVQKLNEASETTIAAAPSNGPASDPMSAVVKILNVHMASLKYIDAEIANLDNKMQQLQRLQQKATQYSGAAV